MKYQSAVTLKKSLLEEPSTSMLALATALPKAAVAATTTARSQMAIHMPFALGVVGGHGSYRLAVRVQTAYAGMEQAN